MTFEVYQKLENIAWEAGKDAKLAGESCDPEKSWSNYGFNEAFELLQTESEDVVYNLWCSVYQLGYRA